ncbi:uncharacterized protein FFB14_05951 [Fusarium fujikuroi]|nr:uncharacterized protein FFB14_05951 [Fusarium fujikuroi]
MPSYPY